jgi:hypothetical protein
MTTVSFHASYAQDFSCFLVDHKVKAVSSMTKSLLKKNDIFSGSAPEIDKNVETSKMSVKRKSLLRGENSNFFSEWQKSFGVLEAKRNEAEKQWRVKEKDFFVFSEDLTKRRFEIDTLDCFILLSKEGKGILSQTKIYVGSTMPDSLLGWACAHGYLNLFIAQQILSGELSLKRYMGKLFDPFCEVVVSLVLMDSPFSISERNELLAWSLSFDKRQWEILRKCYPLWLSRESFFGFVDEAKKIL